MLYDSDILVPVRRSEPPTWTIADLEREVARALAVGYAGPSNGQVRAVPDRRTIRYYTTLGLLDRPAAMDGRTALYARRHLMQIVAIKRLQARGLALGEIQRRLAGLTGAALEEIAALPAPAPAAPEAAKQKKAAAPRAFWKSAASEAAAAPAPPPGLSRAAPSASAPTPPAAPLTGLPLADGATLLVAAARPVTADDLRDLAAAAAPLLDALARRGLLVPPPKGDTP